jgi:hypothetical protein
MVFSAFPFACEVAEYTWQYLSAISEIRANYHRELLSDTYTRIITNSLINVAGCVQFRFRDLVSAIEMAASVWHRIPLRFLAFWLCYLASPATSQSSLGSSCSHLRLLPGLTGKYALLNADCAAAAVHHFNTTLDLNSCLGIDFANAELVWSVK